jgi:DNA-binding beta-propeller fold protein YncE
VFFNLKIKSVRQAFLSLTFVGMSGLLSPSLSAQSLVTDASVWVSIPDRFDATLNNLNIPADAYSRGMWSSPFEWPMNGLHNMILPDGKVLTFGTNGEGNIQEGRLFDVWDPYSGFDSASHTTTYDGTRQDSFCASGAYLNDGSLLISGGNSNNGGYGNGGTIYNWETNTTTTDSAVLGLPRWYSTMLTLPDSRKLIMGGMVPYTEGMYNDPEGAIARGEPSMTPEVYENGNWRSLFGANSRLAFGPDFLRTSFPHAFVAPNGQVFGISADRMWYLDPNANGGQGAVFDAGQFKPGPGFRADPDNVGALSVAVMYDVGKIIQAGGNGGFNGDGMPASNKATSIDINGGAPVLTELPRMNIPRRYGNGIVLANGDVVITGGTRRGNDAGGNEVFAAEIWNPDTNIWALGADASTIRVYHSITSLLLNGAIISTGGGTPGPVLNKTGEVYYPPYLFQQIGGGSQLAPRPVVAGLSGLSYAHGASIQLDMNSTAPISDLVLIGLSNGTHSFNNGQRRIPLTFSQDLNRLTATIPNANLTPPGYYQVVVLNAQGTPSHGIVIAVGEQMAAPAVASVAYTPSTDGSPGPVDTDGDGVPDAQDAFPNDPTETLDSDGDGVGNNADAFPFDGSETVDSDGDGIGDNADPTPNGEAPTPPTSSDLVFYAEATVRFDDLDGGQWQRVFDYGDGPATNNILLGQVFNTDDMRFSFWRDGTEYILDVPDVIVEGETATFIAQITTAGLQQLYKNGVLIGENQASTIPENVDRANKLVGASNWGGDTPLIGEVLAITVDEDGSEGGSTTPTPTDSDGDGVPDAQDAFPNDPSETTDTDGDGIGDNSDPTPNGEVTPAPVGDTPPADAITCAGEGGTCVIPAGQTASVWYGAGTTWNVQTNVTGSIGCNNGVFGDPIFGTVKTCVYAVNASPEPPVDTDGDGVPDAQDAFPNDPTETADSDGDGVGNNADAFPFDGSETVDSDGDGIGDNADPTPNGETPPPTTGTENIAPQATLATSHVSPWETLGALNDGYEPASSADKGPAAYGNWEGAANYGRTDWVSFTWGETQTLGAFEVYWWNDGLGISTPNTAEVEYLLNGAWVSLGNIGVLLNQYNRLDFSALTTNSIRVSMSSDLATGILEVRIYNAETLPPAPVDTDGDGVADEDDAFPNDVTETADTDGDGVGDNADVFPNDASETVDSDGDGIGDNSDPTPNGETPTIEDLSGFVTPIISAGDSVTFDLTGASGNQYSWTFGDGTPATAYSTDPDATHTYSAPGIYFVTLNVRDAQGIVSAIIRTQAVATDNTALQPNSSTAIVVDAVGRIWTVNPDNDSVSVLAGTSNTLITEIPVGDSPRTLAIAPNGDVWVSNKASASVSVISATSLSVINTFSLPRASQPHGLAFAPNGSAAYVALESTGQLVQLDPATGAVQASINVGLHARGVAVTADSATVLVSRFITPALPGESTLIVDTSTQGGEVLVVDTASMTVQQIIMLQHSDLTDAEAQGSGIPNYLAAPVISPDGLSAWVPSKQDNITRGMARNQLDLNFVNTVRAISSRIDLVSLQEDSAARIDHDNSSVGAAAAYHPSGAFAFVALETSRQVAVINPFNNSELFRFEVGLAPQGVAVSADGNTLYVQNFMDRSISVVDLQDLTVTGLLSTTVVATPQTIGSDALSAEVLRGKQLFYDAADDRLARDDYMSCASCHNDGGSDGRVWDLTGFGEGLRNTIELNGRSSLNHGFLHWSANFDELQDFEGQIRTLAGGTGLMSDAAFNAGSTNQPLGDTKAGISADLDALAAYVESLNEFAPSPNRNQDGSLTTLADAGATVFAEQGCASCHVGVNFSNSIDASTLQDIGSLTAESGQRLEGPLTGIDVPTLRDVWKTAPYLHNGSAATLADAVNVHAGLTLIADEMDALVAYLEQIGSEEVTAPTASVTPPPVDTDGDGVPDAQDAFPNDPSETTDTDGDGVGNNADAFPNDASETLDTDGDGVGNNADAFPNDASETVDTDGDGIGDNSDPTPNGELPSTGENWEKCADRFGVCYVPYTTTVRYIAPNNVVGVSENVSNLTFCISVMFGLPFVQEGYCEFLVQ